MDLNPKSHTASSAYAWGGCFCVDRVQYQETLWVRILTAELMERSDDFMIAIKPYRRMHAVEYARTWALSRNPLFSRFDTFGGDCTNFVSQCLFA